MGNLMLFLSSFIHYLWIFGITVILILAACFIGIKWRKSKDVKSVMQDTNSGETSTIANK